MSKILKNNSGSNVTLSDLGSLTINDGTQYTVDPIDYLRFARSSSLVTEVGAGNLVVNDGSNDLSISDGIDLIKDFKQNLANTGPNGLVSVVDDAGTKRLAIDPGSSAIVGPEGPQGPQGPQGPPGPAGIFGSEFHYIESIPQSSTTSTGWQEKLRLTTSSLPSGRYWCVFSAELRNSSDEAAAMARFQINDTSTVGENGISFGDDSPNQYGVFFGQEDLGTISGVNDFTIDWRQQSGGTAFIRRAKITLWRIS